VKLLEQNLKAFGYAGFTADETFTGATTAAVKHWQKDLDTTQTGTVDVSQVVVARGQLRVAEIKARLGAEATGEVLTYTGTTRLVRLSWWWPSGRMC